LYFKCCILVPLKKSTHTMKQFLHVLLPLLFVGTFAYSQTVKGTVTTTSGDGIPGATVSIKGTNVNTVTDGSGKFSIAAGKEFPFSLIIRFVGFKNQEVQIYELPDEPLEITLIEDNLLDEIVVTSRRREEVAQHVPIPITVVAGARAEDAGAFNVNRLKEMIPSVQLYSSNPRNTGLSIRGLGTTFGLTNDGIDPGVGFYVDGVYYARPAATTFDFIDVDRIEVLRGPQGTLFGKNTVAGAFNLTTKKPTFEPTANFEVSYGNYGYIQAKSSISGGLSKKLAGKLSFSGTQRDGTIYHVVQQKYINDLNNLGIRGQLLYKASDRVEFLLIGDASRQRPEGYAQVPAGIVTTQRKPYRQFNAITNDLNYTLPSLNAFDRKVDHNTSWRSGNDQGGVSLNADIDLWGGTLTSTSAWRYWIWDPSNDRDFTGLESLGLSQAPSKHNQYSQEVRWAGNFSQRVSAVFGVFLFGQQLKTDPYHTEESGADQWRFTLDTDVPEDVELWKTPGLLDGYGIRTYSKLKTLSGAVFGQVDIAVTDKFHILPGLRYNYDDKSVNFRRVTYGGLDTSLPEYAAVKDKLDAIKRKVYSNQEFEVDTDNTNLSLQLTASYRFTKNLNLYGTFSTGYKPIGLNLGGLPTEAGSPMLQLAEIQPEYVKHFELGFKTTPSKNSILNIVVYHSGIEDYQAQVQTADLSVNRGYLANAKEVRVQGVELDAQVRVGRSLTLYGAYAYTDGKYVDFTNAPLPLEETGSAQSFKDISGERLPGISKHAASFGAEVAIDGKLLRQEGKFYLALDGYYRSEFSSNPSPSKFLVVDGYALFNARVGFRVSSGTSLSIWTRNLFNQDYFEQLLPAAGNAGLYAGVLGDPRTYGITIRQTF
jgi:iron complex outermembrane receptor protein